MLSHFQLSVFIAVILCTASILLLLTPKRVYNTVALALILISALATYRSINDFYGMPKVLSSTPSEKVKIVSYMADKNKKFIYLWIMSKEDRVPKSYSIAYTKELHKQLRKNRSITKGTPYDGELKITKNILKPHGMDVEASLKISVPALPPKGVE